MATRRNRSDLAEFLRSRREKILPEDVGLPVGARRRTPGLRREEVAILAGLSPTWYTYLEQGRDIRPSPEVLESLARVMQLTEDERRYLHLLANGQAPPLRPAEPDHAGEELLRRIVDSTGAVDTPVYAANLYADVIAWNEAATRWYTDFGQLRPCRRNMLHWMLTDPVARERIVDWEDDTRDVVARFRVGSATRPWDRRFNDLIALMHEESPHFRDWWSDHEVRDQHVRLRTVDVPGEGVRTVQLVVLRMTDSFHSVLLHLPVSTRDAD